MGAGGSPCQTGRISGVCAARPDWQGLPTAPKGGAEGGRPQKGICAPDSRGRRGLMCDMRDYRLPIIINAYRIFLASFDQSAISAASGEVI